MQVISDGDEREILLEKFNDTIGTELTVRTKRSQSDMQHLVESTRYHCQYFSTADLKHAENLVVLFGACNELLGGSVQLGRRVHERVLVLLEKALPE
eukprot:SAG31_NODE_19974_length_587_cov_0.875000_1_plen_97_part_00